MPGTSKNADLGVVLPQLPQNGVLGHFDPKFPKTMTLRASQEWQLEFCGQFYERSYWDEQNQRQETATITLMTRSMGLSETRRSLAETALCARCKS